MTGRAPVLARSDPDGDRFYPWKGETFWSVTTLIGGGVPKYGIAPWSAKVVAELVAEDLRAHGRYARSHAAVRRWSKLGRIDVLERQERGELTSIKLAKLSELDLALRWLKGEPDRLRDAAGRIGSEVHTEAEAQILRAALDASGAVLEQAPIAWPADLADHEASFNAWLTDWRPVYLATEATVFNRTQAYAGTLDALLEVFVGDLLEALARVGDPVPRFLIGRDVDDRVAGVFDYKAGRSVYPEVGMQLAAYKRGEFIGLPDRVTEAPVPPVEFGAVLHLTPRGYHLRLVDVGDTVFAAFLYAREIYRFRKQIAPLVLGSDLAPSATKEAAA